MVAAVAHRTPKVLNGHRPVQPARGGRADLRVFGPLAFELFCFPCACAMVQIGCRAVCPSCRREESAEVS